MFISHATTFKPTVQSLLSTHPVTPPSPIAPLQNPAGDWSSIIGIVTAIIGNVLISFALNTQRYAHIRLERQAKGQDPNPRHPVDGPWKKGEDEQTRKQSKIAKELSRKNAQSEPQMEDGDIYTHDYHEGDPLLPKSKDVGNEEGEEQDEKSDEPLKRKNYLKSKLWWIGISLMVVGEAGNFLAYGFAPASIVSPLGVVALTSNCLIAPIMLKEKFRKRDLLGIAIAVGGAVTVVLSAKGSNPKLGPNEIWGLIKRWEFLTYLGITVGLIIAFMFLSNKYGDKTIIVDIGLVGLFGGYTALSTKGVSSLLSYRLFQVFTFPITYLLVAVLVGTAVMQIKYVNRALQRFNSTQVIPTQFVVFTIFVVVGSAILYRDFENTTAADVGKFVGGVALTFAGVWIITSGRDESSASKQSGGDGADEEEEIDLVDDERTPRINEPSPSPPSTPPQFKARTEPTTPGAEDSPASFVSATSRVGTTPRTSLSKPPMTTTASSPLLPSQRQEHLLTPTRSQPSQRDRPESPLHARSDVSIPQTPRTTSTPQSLGTSIPRDWLKRSSGSIAGMIPGPYTSPLSGGLSVIVADSRRRDEERATLNRRRSTRGAPRRGSASVGIDGSAEGSTSVYERLQRGNTIEVSSGIVAPPPAVEEEEAVEEAAVEEDADGDQS